LSGDTTNQREIDPVSVFRGINGLGIAIVVALVGLLIFLFLKFGGAGGLLRADPKDKNRPKEKKKAWGLTAESEDVENIIAKIRAMADRKAAMILLLRHCLLQASQETNVNFRRSDTERYGGRSIDDAPFEAVVAHGETILKFRS